MCHLLSGRHWERQPLEQLRVGLCIRYKPVWLSRLPHLQAGATRDTALSCGQGVCTSPPAALAQWRTLVAHCLAPWPHEGETHWPAVLQSPNSNEAVL